MTLRRGRVGAIVVGAVGVVGAAMIAAPPAGAAPGGASPMAGRGIVSGDIVRNSPGLAVSVDTTAPVVVTSGLNNPREISLLPDGSVLLIAEAGSGGPACSGTGDDATCVGATGSVSAVVAPSTAKNVTRTRLIKGLLSGASPDGSGAVGADGVSALSLSQIFTIMTYAPPDVLPSGLPGNQSGKLLRNAAYRGPKIFANITAYESAHDPDGQGFDSNPYAVLALPGRTLVADAAGNDILSVSPTGVVSLFAVLPNVQLGQCAGQPNDNGTTGCDFVPTSLAVDSSGNIYVGGLGGEVPGAGRVLKLDANTGKILKYYTGFTAVTGVAVGPDNSLYVSQLAFDPSKGKVTRVLPNGNHVNKVVPFPAGVAVDQTTGAVFVSAFSISPAGGLGIPGIDSSGQIWRLPYAATPAAPAAPNTPPVDRS